MARLRRIFYDNIGHPEARFMNLMIPFAKGDATPTDSVVWLKNGGGKSALLSLLFAVVRPALRDFLGQKVDEKIRTLSDYVLRNDHGVVVLEWEIDDPVRASADPTRLLTGVFLERKTGAAKIMAPEAPEADGSVERLYFSYYVRPDAPDTALDALSLFTDATRSARFASTGFKARLNELAGEAPHAQVVVTDKQTDWLEVLTSRGIDADLFMYQIRMNQREGGAKDLFKECTTIESYINLFLEVLIAREFGDNIRENLSAQREALADRKFKLIPGRALTESLIGGLAPLRDAAAERTLLVARGHDLVTRLGALTTYASQRLTHLAATVADLDIFRESAEADAANWRAHAAAARRRAAAMQRDVALVTVREARAEQQRITERNAELQRLHSGWNAAIPLRDALRHERSAIGYREEIAQRERQHAPLLDRLRGAGAALIGALKAHDETLLARLVTADATITAHEDAERTASAQATAATADAARLESDARAAEERDRLLRADVRQLVRSAVLLREEEPPVDASGRLAEEERDADAALREADRARGEAVAACAATEARVNTTDAARRDAEQRLRTERQALDTAETRAQKISALPRLASVFEVARVDVTTWHEEAVLVLRTQARHAYERALLAHATAAGARRSADALRDTGFLPSSIDVTRVLTSLATVVPQAHAGWRYLADAMTPTEALALIDRAPDIALGIVVRDDDYDAAVRLLRTTPPELDEPVRVVRQSDVGAAPAGQGFVVRPATDAHFDRAAGQRALVSLDRQLTDTEATARRAEADHHELSTTATTLDNFLHDYGAAWFATQRADVARLTAALDLAVRAVADARSAHAAAKAHEAACTVTLRAATDRHAGVVRRHSDLSQFRRRHGDDVDTHRRAAAAARHAAAEAHTRATEHAAQAAGFREEAKAARRSHLGLSEERAVLGQEMQQVTYAPAATLPAPGDRHLLAQAYLRAKDVYEAKIDSHGLMGLAERDEREAKGKRDEVRKRLTQQRHGWTEVSLGELLATLPDPSDAESELARIDADKTALFSLHGNHSKVVQSAESALGEARKACELAGIPATPALDETRQAELPDDPTHALRVDWQKQIAAAIGDALGADDNAASADDMAMAAERQLADARLAERTIDGSMALLRTAQQQQAAFLTQFQAQPAAIATHTPATDEAFTAAVRPWSDDRSALLDAWLALDADRDRAARTIQRLLAIPEYSQIIDPRMGRIRDAEPAMLEAHADELSTELEERLTQIIAAIADIDRHRNVLIQLTLVAGEEGRRLLRQLGTRSMVPATVPDFGGNPVLHIGGLDAADPAVERTAAEALIDSLTTDEKESLPLPLELVQRAVHAIAPRISIRVLYPKTERGLQYWPITQLGKMSGGEGLTVATLLYCTLARVRAIAQGKTGNASSVLLFDNPFGIASAASFITLQREVARALNVQLIYFTGVLDLEAIRLLPNRIRLGNSRYDRASGYLLVERSENDEIVEALRSAEASEAASLTPLQLVVDDTPYLYPTTPAGIEPTADERPSSAPDGTDAGAVVLAVSGGLHGGNGAKSRRPGRRTPDHRPGKP